MSLTSKITYRMAHSRDADELAYMWNAWHDATGKKMRSNYAEYVRLLNKAATSIGLNDAKHMWQLKYDDAQFTETIDRLWTDIQPLYNELHTYIKYKLKYIYGKSYIAYICVFIYKRFDVRG